MSLWHLRLALWGTTALLIAAVPASALGGIWLGSGRLGWTSFVLLVVAVPTTGVMAWWTTDHHIERPTRLPRGERRRLHSEKARVTVDAEIARLEREAGLR